MIRSDALTQQQLCEDVRRFLRSANPAVARIRENVISPLTSLGKTYVIGGLIRDLAIYGLDARPESDVDLVVRCAPAQLEKFAAEHGAAKNRFGGFALRTEAYRVDFWAFSRTWAKQAGHVALRSPADLTKATFFDWDAVVYGIAEHKLWCLNGYLDRLNSGRLDINLAPNPSRLGTLVRALRRLMMWDARPSARLRHYIEAELSSFEWLEIVRAEVGAFHSTYLCEFNNGDEFVEAVLRKASFANRAMDRMRENKFAQIEAAPKAPQPIRKHDHLRVAKMTIKKPKKQRKPEHVGDLFAE